MECNRDEAIRAKTVAEKKFADKDFAGAKRLTLKAQTLYPELDGISQMLITLDAYISSENNINGESDWYAVLDMKPCDDDETIRKQYRKMVLLLHPDKNKSIGADGAFKILSEAWSVLSDKSKRSAYNQRRNPRGFQQKVSPQSTSASSSAAASPGVNVVNSPANRANPKQKGWNSVPAQFPPAVPAQARAQGPPPGRASVVNGSDTFWTVCLRCKMHFEYYKAYLNRTILCRSCHKPFHAVELAAPVNPYANTDLRFSRSVRGNTGGPSGVTKAAKFNFINGLKRECEEFNAQRLFKKRSKVEVSYHQRPARS